MSTRYPSPTPIRLAPLQKPQIVNTPLPAPAADVELVSLITAPMQPPQGWRL